MRIGEIAERTGTTTRTIRYYEELGLLNDSDAREKGKHRSYTESDVERLTDLIRLRELLGVSLEELKTIVEVEDARAALNHVATQLELVRSRRLALEGLEQELVAKRRKIKARLKEELT